MKTNVRMISITEISAITRVRSDTSAFLGNFLGIGHVKQKSTDGSCFEWVVLGKKDFV
jgi:hypothetical protein